MSSLEQNNNNNNNAVNNGGGGGDDDDCSVAASLYSGHADNSTSDAHSMTSGTTDAHSKGATTVDTSMTRPPVWKMICCSRVFILGLVVVAAAAAGTATYFLLENQQEEQQTAEVRCVFVCLCVFLHFNQKPKGRSSITLVLDEGAPL